jgi:hypothetical protein
MIMKRETIKYITVWRWTIEVKNNNINKINIYIKRNKASEHEENNVQDS